MSSTISQLSCFSSIKINFHFQQRRSLSILIYRPKISAVMSVEGHDDETSSAGNMPKLSYVADQSSSSVEPVVKLYPGVEEHANVNGKVGVNASPDPAVVGKKNTAKIHDFCFGIPFGGFILTGGVFGSIFSRNLASLSTGVLFGGSILAFSTFSLKVWKQGKSSYPFIIGQAVLAATLFWKNFKTYSVRFHVGLLYLCAAFRRQSTPKEIEIRSRSCIMTKHLKVRLVRHIHFR
ncbi:protein FATTY ACID EXPORT 1, chloroplastic-like isoform X4 [Amaranthus tricolor]|uniref:protein FATTY ACID EXPORT 1, chloroplastic-like isoform X4 n=1 Tax=Amaranthus tricolor TaxID=29722 RepID=UPI00259015EA|nr:protein FATTY ACID EXPORT 1, chloroplastic-like isoform X4 [Amaranthus tricolor]